MTEFDTNHDERVLRDLLHRATDDLHPSGAVAASVAARQRRRHQRRRAVRGTAVGGVAVAAAAAVVVATTAPARVAHPRRVTVAAGAPTPGTATRSRGGSAVLYRLASVSQAAPAPEGTYVVLAETDSGEGEDGPVQRTSVENTLTGASVTYQSGSPASDIPSRLVEGPDATQTAAYYASLPTDPTALRAALLAQGRAQQAQFDRWSDQQWAKQKLTSKLRAVLSHHVELTDDDLVYQQADTLLWNPMIPPSLRAALYRVLATTSGVVVDPDALDPAGRAAISMTRSYTGIPEVDVTYEDPTTGAVLAQEWNGTGPNQSERLRAVYQPVTWTDTMPSDPFAR